MIQHTGEAIVLRSWPFHEADLLVSLFTREQGRVKGVARHAMRSRRRFGGALEPMTYVRAHYVEKPKQELMRLDSFEILSSPLTGAIDYYRTAGLQLVAEVIEEALPEQAAEDAVFRLALAVLEEIRVGSVALPVTYFCLWMIRLMGWMPELGHCSLCGLDLRGGTVFYSPTSDGVTCADDRRNGAVGLSAGAVDDARRIFRGTVKELATESWPRVGELRRFAVAMLERHLERRLVCARAL
ncbi:DNA repair protein RecO [Granulicella sp. WH15]|uniref:DNA repair protein RecO n=1 Tax=Granulicella sp. WH15 TaxID=2602070 RepID=UPI001366C6C5|nr:DNA repair protein RecO [Granulicella sp. WH15]QHN04350.1 DNA repair protein RecO [Granulicella sp. WH15]